MPDHNTKRRKPFIRLAALFLLVFLALLGSALLRHPDTPLPPEWNVFEPLRVDGPITPVTTWKLDWATSDPELCRQVLQQAAAIDPLEDITQGESCGITARMTLRKVGDVQINPMETACATALRLAMWTEHGVQPLAEEIFGQRIARLRHLGSYNCRRIAGSARWSTHATADAIDIIGFDLDDGTRIRLLGDWQGEDDKAAFLRGARDTSCDWFGTTLGPDYNAAHADHFHLQNRGWGTCR